jgi:hypothetical protein
MRCSYADIEALPLTVYEILVDWASSAKGDGVPDSDVD